MEAILATHKLCKSFSTGGVQQHVLKNLDILSGSVTGVARCSHFPPALVYAFSARWQYRL